jgi:hypothetical protein
MHRPVPAAAAAFAISLVLGACGSQPKLDVTASASTAPASAPVAVPPEQGAAAAAVPADAQAAPPIADDATLPPGHQPVAPPIAPGTAMPANHPPIEGMAGMQAAHGGAGAPTDPVQALSGMVTQGGEGAKAVAWTAPKDWVSEPPANAMRRAQYKVPGKGGAAECVVFYFGPGQGGDPQSNAVRWASQFANADGSPATSAMKTRQADVNGLEVLYVETRGTYLAGSMAGAEIEKKPGYALYGAVVEGPDANWFVKLTGPEATVSAQRAAFESMIGSMKRGG